MADQGGRIDRAHAGWFNPLRTVIGFGKTKVIHAEHLNKQYSQRVTFRAVKVSRQEKPADLAGSVIGWSSEKSKGFAVRLPRCRRETEVTGDRSVIAVDHVELDNHTVL